ncbi:MAG: SPW repeat protein [bacterium]|nr:SPW repeat protein [bacterium]
MKWLNWGTGILGVWLIVSPFILGYWRVSSALWSQIVVGVLISLIAMWQIVGIDEEPPTANN